MHTIVPCHRHSCHHVHSSDAAGPQAETQLQCSLFHCCVRCYEEAECSHKGPCEGSLPCAGAAPWQLTFDSPNCAAQSRAGGPSCARTTPSSALMGTGLLEDQAVTCCDSGYVQCLQNTETTCNSFVAKCGKGKNFSKDVL